MIILQQNNYLHSVLYFFLLSCFGVFIKITLIASVPYVDQLRQLYFIIIGGGFICI